MNLKTKTTFITNTFRWMKRFNINLNNNAEKVSKQVIEQKFNRMLELDNSKAKQHAIKYNIKSGKHLRKAEFQQHLNPIGLNALLRLRTRCFNFTNLQINKSRIPSHYYDKYVCCNEEKKESIWHLLAECTKFSEERYKYLHNTIPPPEQ